MKQELRELKIKIGNKWLHCLIIGDNGKRFIAVDVKDIPKSAFKVFTKKLKV